MSDSFTVGLTRDFLDEEENLTYRDIGLDVLDASGLDYGYLEQNTPLIRSDQLEGINGVISLTPDYTPESFSDSDDLVAVARFGVGYDNVDVEACTQSDIALFIASGAVNYSVAEAVVGWMLALNHHVFVKDRLTRTGGWDERSQYMGTELRDRTLGIIGVGGIGQTLVRLVSGFKMKEVLGFDPYLDAGRAEEIGVRLVDLNTLLKESDFVSVNCPLTDGTRDLIGESELELMKSTAYLINTARGGIVNEQSLVGALQDRSIAGAAMDVFVEEPATGDHPLCKLDNVILAPHSIAWTDEIFRDIGRMNCQQMVALSEGRMPDGLVNVEVAERPGFQKKLARFTS